MTFRSFVLMVLCLLFGSCGGENRDPGAGTEALDDPREERTAEDGPGPIAAILSSEPRFETLASAIEAAGMTEVLEADSPMTLFAPSNEAFEGLPSPVTVELLMAPENRDLLRAILSYHVVGREVAASEMMGSASALETASGQALPFDGTGAVVTVGAEPGSAIVTITDLDASNGVIHVIDSVLLPPAE